MTRPASAHPKDSSRRGGAPRPLAATVAKIAGPLLRRRGFAEARVITEWADIVGAELALHSSPEELVFRRGQVGAGVLHVRVSGSWAVQLQHMEPLVIERINGHFGYRAVDRLHMVQGRLPERRARGKAQYTGPGARSSAPGDEELAARAAGIANDALREALVGLGRAMGRRSARR